MKLGAKPSTWAPAALVPYVRGHLCRPLGLGPGELDRDSGTHGDANIQTTARYVGIPGKEMRAAIEKLTYTSCPLPNIFVIGDFSPSRANVCLRHIHNLSMNWRKPWALKIAIKNNVRIGG